MRILYVGNFGGIENFKRFYLFPQRIVNGLIRNGHNVQVFNDKDVARLSNPFKSSRMGIKKTNALLIQNCEDFRPEMIILAHCQFIHNDTLGRIRALCPGVKIVHLNVDPLSDTGNCDRIRHRVGHVDGIFITTAGDALKAFSSSETFAAFLPNPVDRAIDTGRAFAADTYTSDLFFAAGAMRQNDHRQVMVSHVVQAIPDMVIDIYGAGINDRKIFGMAYMSALASAKMGLVINKTEDYYLYASDRMSQYMGNGLLVFAPVGPRYTDIFTDGDYVTYESEQDLIAKIKYYYGHDDERRALAEKGYRKIHDVFDVDRVARYMVDMTFGEKGNDADYAWPTQAYRGA